MARPKSPALPAEFRAHLPSKDRLLVAEMLDGGAWAVLSRGGLAVVAQGGLEWRRPWHEVDHGSWDGEAHTMTITWVDGTPEVALKLVNESPKEFPSVIREQVQTSLVHVETERLPGGAILRGAIRRDADGQLFSQVTATGRVVRDAKLDARIDALEARVRSAVGLGG